MTPLLSCLSVARRLRTLEHPSVSTSAAAHRLGRRAARWPPLAGRLPGFLHIQGSLFGGRPRFHADALMEFGSSLGLRPHQCRQLEIAYFVRAIFSPLARGARARPIPAQTSWTAIRITALALRRRYKTGSMDQVPALPTTGPLAPSSLSLRHQPEWGEHYLLRSRRPRSRARERSSGPRHHGAAGGSAAHSGNSDADRPLYGSLLVQSLQRETTATYFILARRYGISGASRR